MRSGILWRRGFLLGAGLSSMIGAMAQADGNAGITQANTMVRSYFPAVTDLMFAIGAILGVVGAIKVFSQMQKGDDRVGHSAAVWFGACIFLVVVATVLKSFFGL